MATGRKRHTVDVMRPATGEDSRGQRSGSPTTLIASVPVEIKTLNGRELEQARQTYAAATYSVEMYGDPAIPIKELDYLQFGERKLYIGHVHDPDQNGIKLILLCGESR